MSNLRSKLLRGSLLMLAAGVFSSTVLADEKSSTAEQELLQMEKAFCTAILKNDVAGLAKLSADDYVEIDGSGKVRNKQVGLDFAKNVKATVCEVSEMTVRVYDDSAVVVGRTTLRSDLYNGDLRFTDVFAKRNNAWLNIAGHWSEIK